MSLTVERGMWIVPPQRAVWIPPRTPHEIRMTGAVAMRTIYVAPEIAATRRRILKGRWSGEAPYGVR